MLAIEDACTCFVGETSVFQSFRVYVWERKNDSITLCMDADCFENGESISIFENIGRRVAGA